MSAEDQIKETVGEFRASIGLTGKPMPIMGYETGSPEARIETLEVYVRTLREGLLVAGRQIDDLASKISGS